jgi:hypothetical protein
MYSVMTARYKFFPEVKTKGMTAAPRLVLFTSEHVSLIQHSFPQQNRSPVSEAVLCYQDNVLLLFIVTA